MWVKYMYSGTRSRVREAYRVEAFFLEWGLERLWGRASVWVGCWSSVGFHLRLSWWQRLSTRELCGQRGESVKSLKPSNFPKVDVLGWARKRESLVILNSIPHRRASWMRVRTVHSLVLLLRWSCIEICPGCTLVTVLLGFIRCAKWVIRKSKLRHSFVR